MFIWRRVTSCWSALLLPPIFSNYRKSVREDDVDFLINLNNRRPSRTSMPLLCLSPEYRTMERHRQDNRGEEFDYPPMDPGSFSPAPHPPPWMEPPPPYEVAIKTTCSSTHLRRAYSDTHLATEPLFGQSREISFEVWQRRTAPRHVNRGVTGGHLTAFPRALKHVSFWIVTLLAWI